MTLDQNSNQNSSNRDAVIAQIAAGTEGTATDGLTLETQAHFADATWSGGYWWTKMDRELGPGC